MRKVENTRALCDYYNEIVYKVNKLTEMCGNTPEAIKLRDDIDDMFTVKFSEPLDDVAELQEQIGCPLDVRCRIVIGTVVYDGDGTEYEVDHCEVECFAGINDTFYLDDPYLYDWDSSANFKWKDYKKTWWLKKDKSE